MTDKNMALGFAVVACMLGVSVGLGSVVPAIVPRVFLTFGGTAVIPTRR